MPSTLRRKPAPAKKHHAVRHVGKPVVAKKAAVTGRHPGDAAAPGTDKPARKKATTIRLDPLIEQGLYLLQAVVKRPVNKIVNEALAEYIDRGTAKLEVDFEETLARLREYRRSDPGFKRAIKAFADAEATYGSQDPVEGKRITMDAGPAVTMVRDLLRG
jgi:hypothetical protein